MLSLEMCVTAVVAPSSIFFQKHTTMYHIPNPINAVTWDYYRVVYSTTGWNETENTSQKLHSWMTDAIHFPNINHFVLPTTLQAIFMSIFQGGTFQPGTLCVLKTQATACIDYTHIFRYACCTAIQNKTPKIIWHDRPPAKLVRNYILSVLISTTLCWPYLVVQWVSSSYFMMHLKLFPDTCKRISKYKKATSC